MAVKKTKPRKVGQSTDLDFNICDYTDWDLCVKTRCWQYNKQYI